ncbi:hypothetical protein CPB83DRAFT_852894 [Crepidotus variabilis]|uniref:DUF6533 domain-containing protein n=1 Tax=Crepidotus variabilis TaxID=179855 RepID=A0A9P6EI12_9AGAR|nr:hypothetical protein CPB83DRAFT_852894 [Crepidotus variabilis]
MSPVLALEPPSGGTIPIYGPFKDPNFAAGAQAVNRSSVAALAFLVWDILITFDDEVEYIWPRKWTFPKFTYFGARYLPMMVQTSILLIGSELTPIFHFTSHDCFIWQVFQGVSASTIVVIVDSILILRIFALYHDNRTIRILVCVFFTLEVVGIVVGLALALPGITYDDVCLVVGVPPALIIYGASSIIFQMILFFLNVFKFVKAIRSGWGNVPLVKLLMRDGTWAFILLFFVYVSQIGLYGLKNSAYAGVLYGWLLTSFSFCGYRILMNLNSMANGERPRAIPPPNGPPHTAPTNTNIEFTTRLFSSDPNTDISDNTHLEFNELSPISEPRRLRLDHHYPHRPSNRDQYIEHQPRTHKMVATSQISTMDLPQ